MVNIPTFNEASTWFNRGYGAYPEELSINGTLALTYTLIPNVRDPFLQDRIVPELKSLHCLLHSVV